MRIVVSAVLCALLCSTPIMAEEVGVNQFDALDKNHDGALSRQEFVDGKVQINRKEAVRLFPDMRDMERLNERELKENVFDRMDKNQDGLLSRDEWRRIAPNVLDIRF